MLQNAYFLAKIGADTAENEQHFAEICRDRDAEGRPRAGRHGHGDPGVSGTARSFRVPARRDPARQSGRRRLS